MLIDHWLGYETGKVDACGYGGCGKWCGMSIKYYFFLVTVKANLWDGYSY
jgi:hypothetical protein